MNSFGSDAFVFFGATTWRGPILSLHNVTNTIANTTTATFETRDRNSSPGRILSLNDEISFCKNTGSFDSFLIDV
jgi:hypothetical protein